MPETPPKKIVIVTFWRSVSSREPVLDWLSVVEQRAAQNYCKDLKTVEFGRPLGMPLVRSLGKGLWGVSARKYSQNYLQNGRSQHGVTVILHPVSSNCIYSLNSNETVNSSSCDFVGSLSNCPHLSFGHL